MNDIILSRMKKAGNKYLGNKYTITEYDGYYVGTAKTKEPIIFNKETGLPEFKSFVDVLKTSGAGSPKKVYEAK